MNNKKTEYERFVMSKLAPDIDTANGKLTVAALGLAGETGECVDRVKKALYQAHDLTMCIGNRKMLEELGDVLFYLTLFAISCGFTLDDLAVYNMAKLDERYPRGFDPAHTREQEVL